MCQWYLFVWIFAVGFFAHIVGQVKTVEISGRQENRYGWVPVLAIVIPLIYLAGHRGDMGGWSDKSMSS